MARQRLSRSFDDLRRELSTLSYDFEKLRERTERLKSGVHINDRIANDALVDAFAVTCRRLATFFLSGTRDFQEPRGTDLVADDYISDWRIHCPTDFPELKQAKTKADKEVAHITAERRGLNSNDGPESLWNIHAIEQELLLLLGVFLNHLDPLKFGGSELRFLRSIARYPNEQGKTHPPAASGPEIRLTAKTCPTADLGHSIAKWGFEGKTG
ncbi:MAG TPA: hypothetical protein VGE52_16720 [Pirellulales bacterium]